MKILNIVSLQTKGGVEVIYADMCRASQYTNVTFSSGSSIHPEVRQQLTTLPAKIYQHNRLGSLPIPKIDSLRQAHFNRILRLEKPDLIVGWNRLHDMPALPADIPFIHYEHGTSWYDHPHDGAMKILERADTIIAASYAAKRMLELKWFKKTQDKILVNRNALPASRTQTGVREKNATLHIGFAGRFHPVKAPWTVVETTAELVNAGTKVHAFFAGQGQLLDETKNLAQKLGVAQHCTFLGLVSDMPAFYRKLDYLLVPSIREPFGLVPVEAMAQGCVPLVCNVDGLVESMGDFASTLSIKATQPVSQSKLSKVYGPASDSLRDPQSLFAGDVMKTILNLEANPELKTQITQYLTNRSQKDFTFEKYLKDQEHIYSSAEAK